VPFGRVQRKKDVATRVALPPERGALYGGKPTPLDYARVDVTWTNIEFDEDEINIRIEEGSRSIDASLSIRVLWNKGDIDLKVPTPVSARS
jgi:hypothetical protein